MNESIRFVLDGEIVSVDKIDPTRTVLQYLRENLNRLGSKEGCAEGDCGACTVVVAELDESSTRLHYRAINSCIQFLPTLDGKALITVESLASKEGQLHPVQQAMVDCHGSQCGFCTPGIVMSLFAMYKTQEHANRNEINQALAGNLCRCTGYRPIVDAAEKMFQLERPKTTSPADEEKIIAALNKIKERRTLHVSDGSKHYYSPTTIDELARLVEENEDACILAGGTDVGLWVTKQYRELNTLVYIGNVRELAQIDISSTHIEIGAAVTLSDAMPTLTKFYPDLEELLLRFASPPIRNTGTLVGNVANGSPIGDSMPVLIVIGTAVVLRKGDSTREVPLEDYYLDYMKTAARAGEFIECIRIALPKENQVVRTYKLSKRFDQDISAVCGAYSIEIMDGRAEQVRIAYGGMAAIPKRAKSCEAALEGNLWNTEQVENAKNALDEDYRPLSDMRASAQYRSLSCKNLLQRFFLESSGHQDDSNVYSYGR